MDEDRDTGSGPANAMGKIQKYLLTRRISDGNLKPLP
jgi:hypothetical protein